MPFHKEDDQFKASHEKSDVDFDTKSQHHTLGKGSTQASPGNHNHDSDYSPVGHDHAGVYEPAGILHIPIGGTMIWFSDTIPAQFAALDGSVLASTDYHADLADIFTPDGSGNITLPDLTDVMIIGAGGSRNVGDTGGSETKTIAEANLPAHTHGPGTLSTGSGGQHVHAVDRKTGVASGAGFARGNSSAQPSYDTQTGGSHTHGVNSGVTGSTGSGTALDIMPPTYAVHYIMRVL